MKKKTIIIVAICLLVIIGAMISFILTAEKKPFKDLKPSDIVSATVRLSPPDKTIQIENIEELARLLNEVVIYNEDNSYTEYAGQAAIFTLSLSDGTQKEIIAYNPFLILDRIGYKTKYEPCEALSRYATALSNGE